MLKGIITLIIISLTSIFVWFNFVDNDRDYHIKANLSETQHNQQIKNTKITKISDNSTTETKTSQNHLPQELNALHNGDHDHIPEDIKENMCNVSSGKHQCEINLNTDYRASLTTKEKQAKASEIGVLLSSTNFNEVIEDIKQQSKSDEAYIREQEYTNELIALSNDVYGLKTTNIACDDTLCALVVSTESSDVWQTFQQRFFGKNSQKGNLFVSQTSEVEPETRVLFFPNNNKGIIKRM